MNDKLKALLNFINKHTVDIVYAAQHQHLSMCCRADAAADFINLKRCCDDGMHDMRAGNGYFAADLDTYLTEECDIEPSAFYLLLNKKEGL